MINKFANWGATDIGGFIVTRMWMTADKEHYDTLLKESQSNLIIQ